MCWGMLRLIPQIRSLSIISALRLENRGSKIKSNLCPFPILAHEKSNFLRFSLHFHLFGSSLLDWCHVVFFFLPPLSIKHAYVKSKSLLGLSDYPNQTGPFTEIWNSSTGGETWERKHLWHKTWSPRAKGSTVFNLVFLALAQCSEHSTFQLISIEQLIWVNK